MRLSQDHSSTACVSRRYKFVLAPVSSSGSPFSFLGHSTIFRNKQSNKQNVGLVTKSCQLFSGRDYRQLMSATFCWPISADWAGLMIAHFDLFLPYSLPLFLPVPASSSWSSGNILKQSAVPVKHCEQSGGGDWGRLREKVWFFAHRVREHILSHFIFCANVICEFSWLH